MKPCQLSSPPTLISRLMIVLAAMGGLLFLVAEIAELPIQLEHFIRSNSAAWLLGCVILAIAGVRLLWQAGHRQTDWQPTRPGKRFQTIIVYTRPDCLLCEESLEVLGQYRLWLPIPSEVNIDDDAKLRAEFHESIPVVEIDGRQRFRGSINEFLLRRLIEGTPPLPDLRIR